MFKIKSKGNFIFSVAFFIVMSAICAVQFPATDVPEKTEIQYSTGIFHIVTPAKFVNHVDLSRIGGSNDSKVFSCAYNAISNGRQSTCGDTKFLQPYVGKEVTIGWYRQQPFLGFKNDMPQLVSIEMNGEIMRSYEQTAKTNDGLKYVNIGLYILAFLLSVFLYWNNGRIDKKFAKKKSE
ncbi:hypothetical protein [Psychrobacter celer]|uniref:hypothetical protein n=1 Tax=Psychrobacter celer TaxID=306572 RepID=UPI003FCFD741